MKKTALLLTIICAVFPAAAHVVNYDPDAVPTQQVFINYLVLGFEHIIPAGLDHILFICCIFFLNTNIKKVILQASLFTLAHSVTLGLAMSGIINPAAGIIEPLIALSIVFLAVENILSDKVKPWRIVMVFLFGLVHGMGFAAAIADTGMPRYAFAEALIGFNIGVELGQLSIILFLYFFIAKIFSRKIWYRPRIVIPISAVIALIACYWTVERAFFA